MPTLPATEPASLPAWAHVPTLPVQAGPALSVCRRAGLARTRFEACAVAGHGLTPLLPVCGSAAQSVYPCRRILAAAWRGYSIGCLPIVFSSDVLSADELPRARLAHLGLKTECPLYLERWRCSR